MNDLLVPTSCLMRSRPTRVLCADPEESALAVYHELQGAEFDLVLTRGGVECMDCLRRQAPDVLVLDPRLLWGGGDGILSFMQDSPALVLVPVMILTSCRDVSLLRSIAPYRISDYHVKPVTSCDLAMRIRNVLQYGRNRMAVLNRNGSEQTPEQIHPKISVVL